jgi:hypothetical protein
MRDKKSLPPWAHVLIGASLALVLFVFVFVITGGTSEVAQNIGFSIGRFLSPFFAGALIAAPIWWLIEKILERRHPPITLSTRNNWYLFFALLALFTLVVSIRVYTHGSLF